MTERLWLTVGSDHTDRKAETMEIALSKQLCPKPVGRELWLLEDVAGHWDQLQLRAFATIDGRRVTYQEGTLAGTRTPADLVARYGAALRPGTLMFCGTLAAIGGIRPASRRDGAGRSRGPANASSRLRYLRSAGGDHLIHRFRDF